MSEEEEETTRGPWTNQIYKDHAGPMFKAVGELAEYLKLEKLNVLYLVPNDPEAQEKMGEFVSNFIMKYNPRQDLALVWFESKDEHYKLLLDMLK